MQQNAYVAPVVSQALPAFYDNSMSSLQAEDVYLSCKLEMTQLIMNGCTTSSDDQYVNPNDVKLDDAIRAAREVGIRFQPARATTNQGDAVPGRPCPPALLEDEGDALKDMKRCIEEFHDDQR